MKRKIMSVLLAVVMLLGILTGCSKTTTMNKNKFIKSCEKLKLTELDIDELDEIENNVEDGFYFVGDEDLLSGKSKLVDYYLKMLKLSKAFTSDDIVYLAFAAKCAGYEDLKDVKDPEDAEIDGAFVFQMDFGQKGKAEEFMDGVEYTLKKVGIKTKKLTPKEYYVSENEGYLRFHIDLEKLSEIILDDDDTMKSLNKKYGDVEDILEGLKGDVAVSIEIKGSTVFIFAGGAVNSEKKVYKDFVKAFGLAKDPMTLPMNEEIAEDLTDKVVTYVKYISKTAKKKVNIPKATPTPEPDTDVDPDVDPDVQGMGKVGISLPTKDLMRWAQDGSQMKKELEALGYKVDLQYAANTVKTQIAQIESMINSGCEVLIIAAIESTSLNTVLKKAEEKGIPVIAYDRLIYETDTIDYYVTFDNFKVGHIQAVYIVNALNLDSTKGPYNIEITAGDPSDISASYFYQGAMDVLEPYISSGKLVIVSGQKDFKDVATDAWKTDNAQARAENIIGAYYQGGTNIDAWLCSNDSTALGVANALAARYTGNYPVITGQDCDLVNVKLIINNMQAMSVFKDTRTLASQAVKMASQILSGKKVDVNETQTYNNGKISVPTYACDPVFVTADNYKTVLIDSGYYTEDQLGL